MFDPVRLETPEALAAAHDASSQSSTTAFASATRGQWKVSTTGWIYELYRDNEPVHHFHWHPVGDSQITEPHLHSEGGGGHILTGRILIEDVLALAVELGAEPLREGWTEFAADKKKKFAAGAT